MSIRALSEFWNCAVTVSGCLRVFTVDGLHRFWPAVSVLTVCRFFRPFFGRVPGRNDLFFLRVFCLRFGCMEAKRCVLVSMSYLGEGVFAGRND